MEYLNITPTKDGFAVNGLSKDAKKIVRLSGKRPLGLAHLTLHRSDLGFAKECLLALQQHNGNELLQQCLWRCAIFSYVKCFQSGVRTALPEDKVYKGMLEEKKGHTRIMHVRNKHFAHDINSLSQGLAAAAINDGTKEYMVEKIFAPMVNNQTLDQGHAQMLFNMVEHTIRYVEQEADVLADLIKQDMEKETYEQLAARPSLIFTVAGIDDVAMRREE